MHFSKLSTIWFAGIITLGAALAGMQYAANANTEDALQGECWIGNGSTFDFDGIYAGTLEAKSVPKLSQACRAIAETNYGITASSGVKNIY